MYYTIEQGYLTASGRGDYHIRYTTNNKADALKHFNAIKKDVKGYIAKKGYYVETLIFRFSSFEAFKAGEEGQAIEGYEVDF